MGKTEKVLKNNTESVVLKMTLFVNFIVRQSGVQHFGVNNIQFQTFFFGWTYENIFIYSMPKTVGTQKNVSKMLALKIKPNLWPSSQSYKW